MTQIECMTGKVLSLSAPEKVINVHDDTDEKRAFLLKRIDVRALRGYIEAQRAI